MRNFYGSVRILHCESCAAEIPEFDFFGETDVANVGLLSGFQCGTLDLYVFEVSPPDRWVAFMKGREVGFDFQGVRIETTFVVRVIEAPPTEKRLSIAERVRTAQLNKPVFKCPCCKDGEARAGECITVQAFEQLGGRIIIADGLQMVPYY
ncbi:hypothetical protein [Ponticaulis sp.]|uniref:hypothetical protein n=1 Tax=Ponticaulis sp. TaxID=2020902 RepID=UPI00261A1B01|nr:hypothetical protein [Ponticaulis sp.]MDF1682168.1 hypothetical protein [Ponticaulis sp.]